MSSYPYDTAQHNTPSFPLNKQEAGVISGRSKLSCSPEFRFWIALLISVTLYGIAASTGNGWIFLFSSSLITALLIALVAPVLSLSTISIKQSCPDHSNEDSRFKSKLVLASKASLIRPNWIIVKLLNQNQKKEIKTNEEVAIIESFKDTITMEINCGPWKRGLYNLPPVQLESSYPFGLIWMKKTWTSKELIVIHPRIIEIEAKFIFRLKSNMYVPGGSTEGKSGFQSNASKSVREYIRGDSRRFIHWSLSARHNKLMVREYEKEGTPAFDLALDLAAAWTSQEQFELAIVTVASLLEMGHKAGIHPSLYILQQAIQSSSELPPYSLEKKEQLDLLAALKFKASSPSKTATSSLAAAFTGQQKPIIVIQPLAKEAAVETKNNEEEEHAAYFLLRIADKPSVKHPSSTSNKCLTIYSEEDLQKL